VSYEIGTAWLQIVPSFAGVAEAINAEATKWGATSGGNFADSFKARVDAALKSLPDAKVGIDATEADAKLAAIRADLESLSGKTVGVDLSDADAIFKIDEIKAKLDDLSRKDPTIKIHVDAAQAELGIAAVGAESRLASSAMSDAGGSAGGLSGFFAGLGGDAAGASGGMSGMMIAAVALAPVLASLGGVAAGAFAALPAMIAGAVTGMGALYLGVAGVFGAIQAYTNIHSSGASSAGQSLSNAQSEKTAINSVITAQEALNNARINGASAVAAAERNLATTQTTAIQNIINAEQQLVNAERAVTTAQYSEVQAQNAVVAARETAQRQLDDYANSVADSAISQRQAALDVQTTKAALDAATASGSTATSFQKQQAQITYDQALQRVKDLQTANQQLTQDASAAQKAGVDGNPQVLAANHQLTQAQQAVNDAINAQTQAQQNLVTVTNNGNQAIILSEQQLQTVKDQTAQRVSDSVRALQLALENEKLAFERASLPIGAAASSLQQYQNALGDLTPEGRKFVEFFTSQVYPVFTDLKNKVQAAFLPLIQGGITNLLPFFRDLTPLLIQAAKGIGGTVSEITKFMGSKAGLADMMQIFKDGNGFMASLGGNFVTMFKAITTIGAQATPIVTAISHGITQMVNSFAKWVAGGGFEKFLVWLEANGPAVVQAVLELVIAAGRLVVVLTPIGDVMVRVIGFLATLVAWVVDGWQRFSSFALVLGGVLLIISNFVDPIQWLIGALIALGYGVFELATHWRQFWADLKKVTSESIDMVVDFFKALPQRALTAIEDFPMMVWGAIVLADTWLHDNIGVPLMNFIAGLPHDALIALKDFIKIVWAAIIFPDLWLIEHIAKPLVDFLTGLPAKALTALGNFGAIVWAGLVMTGDWLLKNIADPILNFFVGLPGKIASAASNMWHGISDAFKEAINTVIGWWDQLHFKIPGFHLGPIHFGGFDLGLPQIPKYHDGGVVQGAPGVEQLAFLMPGEIVTPANKIGAMTASTAIPAMTFNLYGVDFAESAKLKSMMMQTVVDGFTQVLGDPQRTRVA
jgi:hypothetical protein